MAFLNNFVRRVLGPMSFPRFPVPQETVATQVYQPSPQVKATTVPVPTPIITPPV